MAFVEVSKQGHVGIVTMNRPRDPERTEQRCVR